MSLTGLREYLQKHPDQLIGSDELCLGLAAEAEGIAKYTATHLDERQVEATVIVVVAVLCCMDGALMPSAQISW